jgi:hypothetical protein
MFGTLQVGAIHGRLLTAWSTAAIAGPTIVTYIREYQLAHGVAKADAYSVAIYIMVAVLSLGFLCNLLTRPVDEKHHEPVKAPVAGAVASAAASHAAAASVHPAPALQGTSTARLATAWVFVSIPLIWGVSQTLAKALALFS